MNATQNEFSGRQIYEHYFLRWLALASAQAAWESEANEKDAVKMKSYVRSILQVLDCENADDEESKFGAGFRIASELVASWGIHNRKDVDLALPYKRLLGQCTIGKHLFRTDNGLLGLGLDTAEANSKIYVICGAETPYVTRRRGHSSLVSVGNCFILDFMHGEMLDDHKLGIRGN